MEQLIKFGFDLYESVQPLVKFLTTEMDFVFVGLDVNGAFNDIRMITITPAYLLSGSGLVIFLVAKVYKFILELIPFV